MTRPPTLVRTDEAAAAVHLASSDSFLGWAKRRGLQPVTHAKRRRGRGRPSALWDLDAVYEAEKLESR